MTETETTQAVFKLFCDFKREHDGAPPTVREINTAFGWSSSASAKNHLKKLERAGLLYRKDRRWCVRGGSWQMAPAFTEVKE